MPSAQIDVPEEVYWGRLSPYFMPEVLTDWLKGHGFDGRAWNYSSSNSWGNGRHEDGTSNVTHSYIVKDILEIDCLAFKIQFPECKVHWFE